MPHLSAFSFCRPCRDLHGWPHAHPAMNRWATITPSLPGRKEEPTLSLPATFLSCTLGRGAVGFPGGKRVDSPASVNDAQSGRPAGGLWCIGATGMGDKADKIDRIARDRAARLIHAHLAGTITADDVAAEWPHSESDRGVSSARDGLRGILDEDLWAGLDSPPRCPPITGETLRHWRRCEAFLLSDTEYSWPRVHWGRIKSRAAVFPVLLFLFILLVGSAYPGSAESWWEQLPWWTLPVAAGSVIVLAGCWAGRNTLGARKDRKALLAFGGDLAWWPFINREQGDSVRKGLRGKGIAVEEVEWSPVVGVSATGRDEAARLLSDYLDGRMNAKQLRLNWPVDLADSDTLAICRTTLYQLPGGRRITELPKSRRRATQEVLRRCREYLRTDLSRLQSREFERRPHPRAASRVYLASLPSFLAVIVLARFLGTEGFIAGTAVIVGAIALTELFIVRLPEWKRRREFRRGALCYWPFAGEREFAEHAVSMENH